MASVLQWSDHGRETSLRADVVVVGTGAGGAVAAAELAEGGLDVVMVEEGPLSTREDFNPDTVEMMSRLYRDFGTNVIWGPPHIAFAEGRCVGGSTTINGGMSYRTPDRVLQSWAQEHRLPSLAPDRMAPFFDRVERRIAVGPQLDESIGGDSHVIRKGADGLGWGWLETARNQAACVGTNNCAFGCPTGAKQSTLESYVPRALAAGATLVTDCRVDTIRMERGRPTGVAGHIVDPRTRRRRARVVVSAPRVVVSCGAVQTPLLLLRQRLANHSGALGRNFLCHPNVKVLGLFPHDVKGWQGVSQGQQVRHFVDEGILIAENFVPPGFIAVSLPSVSDATWRVMTRYNQMVAGGVLVEDSVTGTVKPGPLGTPRISYRISDRDLKRFVRGAALLSRLFFEAGAERVILPFVAAHEITNPSEVDGLEHMTIRRKEIELFTVHLMGTARMGFDPRRSVVDEWGQTHDVPGLYVADASVFPTAIGVNPQVTIMALATRTARRILES